MDEPLRWRAWLGPGHLAPRLPAGGRERLVERGMQAPQDHLRTLFGEATPELIRLH